MEIEEETALYLLLRTISSFKSQHFCVNISIFRSANSTIIFNPRGRERCQIFPSPKKSDLYSPITFLPTVWRQRSAPLVVSVLIVEPTPKSQK